MTETLATITAGIVAARLIAAVLRYPVDVLMPPCASDRHHVTRLRAMPFDWARE